MGLEQLRVGNVLATFTCGIGASGTGTGSSTGAATCRAGTAACESLALAAACCAAGAIVIIVVIVVIIACTPCSVPTHVRRRRVQAQATNAVQLYLACGLG